MSKLHLLHANFEKVPEIADEKINPLLNNSIRELDVLIDRDKFKSRYIRLCDSLVELLHIQVMGANPGKGAIAAQENETTSHKTGYMNGDDKISQQDNHIAGSGNKECPVCQNIIDSSNKLLICQECGIRFCHTCESWFRDERQRGEGPICNNCFTTEQERLSREREKKSLKGTAEEAERKRKEERLRKELEEAAKQPAASIKNSIEMEFVLIPSGEFQMGSNEHSAEQPAHKVKISKPFYLGKYPVTQKEWKAVMGSNPSYYKGDNGPVEQVSWNDVQEFVRKLNSKEGNEKYRLPSEAEWEYACRAGTTTKYCFGDNESKLDEYAWYNVNSEGKTHPVGQKKPNLWGLCDMHGNVWEWVQDKWHDSYKFAPTDGSALEGSSSLRVFRGGSWYGNVGFCRSANRGLFSPINCNNGLGFRLLRAV
ncbi:SUMF1/EgtB/PvdO family nonheme iron enzyme [uncultured Methanomethylovorans sp.]|uniref:SUMF1/EgtB/PvdO family nonheme iron enzyme n=1 Tax=uncultured Methanomethylovorans sp. TaxID=183759 RepID=UPI002AA885C0|nr:SUMF1/EgtB/PvdO family nonheme iron enzyme [uncultured Methanomethylovorans sp.]